VNKVDFHFGDGKSDKLFLKLIKSTKFWQISHQKQLQEIN